jgi:hypothetical protein
VTARVDRQGLPIIGSVAFGLGILAGFFALVMLFFIGSVGIAGGDSFTLDAMFFSFVGAMVLFLAGSLVVTWRVAVHDAQRPGIYVRSLTALSAALALVFCVAALLGSDGAASLAALALIAVLFQVNVTLRRRVRTGPTPF